MLRWPRFHSDKLTTVANSPKLKRRMVTFSRTIVAWLVLTTLLPLVALLAAAVDLARWLMTRKPWITVRLLGIGWVYLSAQVAVIVIAALQWLASLAFGAGAATRRQEWTYTLQRWWVRILMAAMRTLLGVRFEARNTAAITPGPIILLFRHASIMDNLLPYAMVADDAGIRLRWVLKKELLNDPALDIGGHRTPNYFVDRDSDSPAMERERIAELGSDLGSNEGIILFPEGTRYARAKFEERMARLAVSRPDLHEIMAGHDLVLPPRSGGVVALLDAGYDVVFGVHSGLEDLRGLGDIWANAPVGRTVLVSFRRVAAASIPTEPDDRIRWLHEEWAKVDETVRSLRKMSDG